MPSRLASDAEHAGAGRGDGRSAAAASTWSPRAARCRWRCSKTLAARAGRPVMIAALLHNGTNPRRGVRRPRRDQRRQRARPHAARPGLVLPADDGLHARLALPGGRAAELEAGARRCKGAALKARARRPAFRDARARRAGRAGDLPPLQRRMGQGARGARWRRPAPPRAGAEEHRRASPPRRASDPLDAMLDLALDEDLTTIFTAQLLNSDEDAVARHADAPAQHRLAQRRRRAPDLLQRRRLRPAPDGPLGARPRRDDAWAKPCAGSRCRARRCSACAAAACCARAMRPTCCCSTRPPWAARRKRRVHDLPGGAAAADHRRARRARRVGQRPPGRRMRPACSTARRWPVNWSPSSSAESQSLPSAAKVETGRQVKCRLRLHASETSARTPEHAAAVSSATGCKVIAVCQLLTQFSPRKA